MWSETTPLLWSQTTTKFSCSGRAAHMMPLLSRYFQRFRRRDGGSRGGKPAGARGDGCAAITPERPLLGADVQGRSAPSPLSTTTPANAADVCTKLDVCTICHQRQYDATALAARQVSAARRRIQVWPWYCETCGLYKKLHSDRARLNREQAA